jgi:AAA domain-containing protein/topoisomerase-like DNA binding C4 zinc finger protein/phospholipase D-like protein
LKQQGYLDGREALAVCTPYAAQTKLIRKLLESESLIDVQVGTVHAFQGDERKAMVLEIPESEVSSKLGRFVTGVPPDDTGARLINVAVSRAQNHLIVIANLAHLDRLLPSHALLRSVLHQMGLRGRVIPAKPLLAIGPLEKDLQGLEEVELSESARALGLFNQTDFDGAFAADIGRARESVAIFSGFVSHNRVGELTRLLGESIESGVKVRCISKPPHTNSNRPILGKRALDMLEETGCAVDGREWIHQKVILIDGQIVWQGSLNPLSYSQRTDEIMVRLVNPEFARLVAKKPTPFAKILEQVADPENPRCGACGARTYYHVQRRIELFTCENRCGWSTALSDVHEADVSTPAMQPQFDELPPTGQSCPECGAQTVKRKGPFGTFYGCSRFPKCRGKWTLRDMPLSN